MKTSEFVEKINSLGFGVVFRELHIVVENSTGSTLLVMQSSNRYALDTEWSYFELLDDETQAELFGVAVEYASTKPEERQGQEESE